MCRIEIDDTLRVRIIHASKIFSSNVAALRKYFKRNWHSCSVVGIEVTQIHGICGCVQKKSNVKFKC